MRYRLEVQICGGFSLISLPCHLGLWNKLLPVSNSVWVPIVGIIDLIHFTFRGFRVVQEVECYIIKSRMILCGLFGCRGLSASSKTN